MRLFDWPRRARESIRNGWLDTPAGCADCGTGGPYVDERQRVPLTRYVYVEPDLTACSLHPAENRIPAVDYGVDQIVTFRQSFADAGDVS